VISQNNYSDNLLSSLFIDGVSSTEFITKGIVMKHVKKSSHLHFTCMTPYVAKTLLLRELLDCQTAPLMNFTNSMIIYR
jgi:hypothetical protein